MAMMSAVQMNLKFLPISIQPLLIQKPLIKVILSVLNQMCVLFPLIHLHWRVLLNIFVSLEKP